MTPSPSPNTAFLVKAENPEFRIFRPFVFEKNGKCGIGFGANFSKHSYFFGFRIFRIFVFSNSNNVSRSISIPYFPYFRRLGLSDGSRSRNPRSKRLQILGAHAPFLGGVWWLGADFHGRLFLHAPSSGPCVSGGAFFLLLCPAGPCVSHAEFGGGASHFPLLADWPDSVREGGSGGYAQTPRVKHWPTHRRSL